MKMSNEVREEMKSRLRRFYDEMLRVGYKGEYDDFVLALADEQARRMIMEERKRRMLESENILKGFL